MREGYDVAQVCPNGHMVNSSHTTFPEFSKEYCDRCGEKTITQCPNCDCALQGHHYSPGVLSLHNDQPPAFCHNCGKPFPWTERRTSAAIDMFLDETGFNGEEAEEFRRNVIDIVRDVPRTPVAVGRFKRAMSKVTVQVANAIRDILVDIVSESAKKMIWPDK